MEDIEFERPEAIKAYQEGRLAEALQYLAEHSKYYQRMFESYHIDITKIRTLEDLVKIPFTEKKDLQLFNDDFLCCPKEKIVDYVTTSGTLGDPVTFGCTDKDLDRLAFNEEKSFACAGVKPGDIVQLTIQRLKPDTIMCVPSFILRLIQYAEEHGIDYKNSSVRRIIGIGEGLRDQQFDLNLLGRRIKEKWDVELFATYSSTEMGATFSECPYGCGGHVHPELIIVEIIGEDNLPVPDGEVGEIVVTTLGVEGMPLLRFRTGDMAAKVTEQCKCGRWSYRLTPLVGRKNNMIKLKGTTLYPPAVNDVLDNADYVENYVVIVDESDAGTDDVLVKLGLKYQPEFDAVKDLKDRFRSRIRVAPRIEVCPPAEVAAILYPAKSRKPVKFIDNRPKHV